MASGRRGAFDFYRSTFIRNDTVSPVLRDRKYGTVKFDGPSPEELAKLDCEIFNANKKFFHRYKGSVNRENTSAVRRTAKIFHVSPVDVRVDRIYRGISGLVK